jgi:hypothetical protein
VTVTPDLWSLTSTPKVLRSIEVEKLVLAAGWASTGFLLWTEPASDSERAAGACDIGSVKLDDATVKARGSQPSDRSMRA